MAALHGQYPGIARGARARADRPSTADRHVVITDYIFGDALAAMHLPAERSSSGTSAVSSVSRCGSRTARSAERCRAVCRLIGMALVRGSRVTPDEYGRQRPRLLDEFSAACNREMRRSAPGPARMDGGRPGFRRLPLRRGGESRPVGPREPPAGVGAVHPKRGEEQRAGSGRARPRIRLPCAKNGAPSVRHVTNRRRTRTFHAGRCSGCCSGSQAPLPSSVSCRARSSPGLCSARRRRTRRPHPQGAPPACSRESRQDRQGQVEDGQACRPQAARAESQDPPILTRSTRRRPHAQFERSVIADATARRRAGDDASASRGLIVGRIERVA